MVLYSHPTLIEFFGEIFCKTNTGFVEYVVCRVRGSYGSLASIIALEADSFGMFFRSFQVVNGKGMFAPELTLRQSECTKVKHSVTTKVKFLVSFLASIL